LFGSIKVSRSAVKIGFNIMTSIELEN